MSPASPHLKALEEIEREGISCLVEVLREEGIDAVRYFLWDATGWHKDYSPPRLAYPGDRQTVVHRPIETSFAHGRTALEAQSPIGRSAL
jgi:hypothetical protein